MPAALDLDCIAGAAAAARRRATTNRTLPASRRARAPPRAPNRALVVGKRRGAHAARHHDSHLTCGHEARRRARARTRNDAQRRVPVRRPRLMCVAPHSWTPSARYRARINAKLAAHTRMHNSVILHRCASPRVPYSQTTQDVCKGGVGCFWVKLIFVKISKSSE